MHNTITEIQHILQRFQDGYTARDAAKLDAFMELFVPGDDAELIGIGASVRHGNEWFQGIDAIRDIIASDWQYWGDVQLEIADARITVKGDAAWLSTTGTLLQTDHIHSDDVTGFSLQQMQEILSDETLSPRAKLVEAAHFGVRRWRERELPTGYPWPFVLTAVLVRQQGQWRFHTIHWSMPVD